MDLDLALTDFVEPFLSLFVAMNAIGVLPLFIGMTEGMSVKHRRSLVRRAISTAFAIALVIVLAGRVIFDTLGITVNDLRIGGGLILLVLSITDLLFSNLTRKTQSNSGADAMEDLGVVPLGTPLTVGPAAITTILVLQEGYGYLPTVVALIANLIVSFTLFFFGPAVISYIGAGASRAIGKVASLFLAAIAIAMIRTGVVGIVNAL
ncbi:MarC family protein [Longibacter sp.]|jgi:multiple antibiotic resistance protein|uniref:MarC family protein n=1 Tax=Longibacter sp. TaxID=2045415 RepID=UPI003EBFD06D